MTRREMENRVLKQEEQSTDAPMCAVVAALNSKVG